MVTTRKMVKELCIMDKSNLMIMKKKNLNNLNNIISRNMVNHLHQTILMIKELFYFFVHINLILVILLKL